MSNLVYHSDVAIGTTATLLPNKTEYPARVTFNKVVWVGNATVSVGNGTLVGAFSDFYLIPGKTWYAIASEPAEADIVEFRDDSGLATASQGLLAQNSVQKSQRRQDRTRTAVTPEAVTSISRAGASSAVSASANSTGATFFGVATGTTISKSIDNGASWSAVQNLGESITGLCRLSDGRILAATGTVDSSNPTAYIHLWRATETDNLVFERVDDDGLQAGGYVAPWAMSAFGNNVIVGAYGYKVGTGIAKGRYAWVSNDNGLTWRQAVDVGAVDNRHIHCVHIDTLGVMWTTQGDDTSGLDYNAIRRSTDGGFTWSLHFLIDPDTGDRVQFTGLTDTASYNGYVYAIQDSSAATTIWRWKSEDIEGTAEIVYSAGQRTGLTAPWYALGYTMGADPVEHVIYAYYPGGSGTRGRFMFSADGVNWRILLETSKTNLTPPSTVAKFSFGANMLVYDNYYIARLKVFRQEGVQSVPRLRITGRVEGTLSAKTVITFDPTLEGYGLLRVTNCYLYVDTASATQAITATPKRAGATIVQANASVAAGATGSALRAKATMANGPQVLINGKGSSAGNTLTVDIATGGSSDAVGATVVVELEYITDSGWAEANTQ